MKTIITILILCLFTSCMQVKKVTGFKQSKTGVKYYPTKQGLQTKQQRKTIKRISKDKTCVYEIDRLDSRKNRRRRAKSNTYIE